jgi:5-formyltetrahydrofolate cyclo-ligase
MRVAPPSSVKTDSKSPVNAERERLRRQLRARRRELTRPDRDAAAVNFARVAQRHLLLRTGQRIAVYIPHGHEADLSAVIDLARRRNGTLYLPAITSYRLHRMEFFHYDPTRPLRVNRYGIPEPDRRYAASIPVRHLDLIFVPLLAFDSRGWRLGSGAGFYDRRLHHLRDHRAWRRPRLVGVGYEFQHVARLDPQPWDVPLDAILTDTGLHAAQRIERAPPQTQESPP